MSNPDFKPITLTLTTIEDAIYLEALVNQSPVSEATISQLMDECYPGGSNAACDSPNVHDSDMYHHINNQLSAQGLPTDTAGLKQLVNPLPPTELSGYSIAYHPSQASA